MTEHSAVWVIRSGRSDEGSRADEFWAQSVVALSFRAAAIGSVKGLAREEIARRIEELWEARPAQIRSAATQLYAFASKIKIGDIAVTPHIDPDYLLLGRIAGPYEYRDPSPVPRWKHIRMVRWVTSTARASLPEPERRSLSSQQTVFQPRNHRVLRGRIHATR